MRVQQSERNNENLPSSELVQKMMKGYNYVHVTKDSFKPVLGGVTLQYDIDTRYSIILNGHAHDFCKY